MSSRTIAIYGGAPSISVDSGTGVVALRSGTPIPTPVQIGGDPLYNYTQYGIPPAIVGNFLEDGVTPDAETQVRINILVALGIPEEFISIIVFPVVVLIASSSLISASILDTITLVGMLSVNDMSSSSTMDTLEMTIFGSLEPDVLLSVSTIDDIGLVGLLLPTDMLSSSLLSDVIMMLGDILTPIDLLSVSTIADSTLIGVVTPDSLLSSISFGTVTMMVSSVTELFFENFDALSSLPVSLTYDTPNGTFALANALANKGTGKVVTGTRVANYPTLKRTFVAALSKGYAEFSIAFATYARHVHLSLANGAALPVLFQIGQTSAPNSQLQLKVSPNAGVSFVGFNLPNATPAYDYIDLTIRVRMEWDLTNPTNPIYTYKYSDSSGVFTTITPETTPSYLTNIANINNINVHVYATGGVFHLDYITMGSIA